MDILRVSLLALLMAGCGGSGSTSSGLPPPPPPTPEPEPYPCTVTLRWELPTEYEDGTPLAAEDIELMTIYADDFVADIDPHTLAWTFSLERSGTFEATVTADGEESELSNSTTKECIS